MRDRWLVAAGLAAALFLAAAAWVCVAVARQADEPESVDDWPGP